MDNEFLHGDSPENINYIYEWTFPRENCWSGTPLGVFNALSSLCSVSDIDPNDFNNSSKLKAITNKARWTFRIWIKKIIGILFGEDCGLLRKRRIEKTLSEKIINKVPSIVYTDFLCDDTDKMYVYQDLSLDFCVRYVEADPDNFPIIKASRLFRDRYLAHEKLFYQRCAGIFTMSEWLKEDIVENVGISPDKICVVNAGCNVKIDSAEELRMKMSQKNGKRFLFVGKEWERKNGPLVLEAFSRLSEKYKDIELNIIGPESDPVGNWQNDNIFFVGRVDYSEVKKYYDKCDFFVMPSKFEAFGIVFVEALLNGLPCIGRDAFAMPEIIQAEKSGYLLTENSPDLLAALMEKMIQNRTELNEYIFEHRDEYIERYSWNGVAKKMVDFINASQCQ